MRRPQRRGKGTRSRSRAREEAQFIETSTVPTRGPARFTIERFLHGIGDVVLKNTTLLALRCGYQLEVARVPYSVAPVIVILAAYGRHHAGVELVDDYDKLMELQREATSVYGECAHTDLFLASCIAMLHRRDEFPCYEAFEAVGVPKLFDELIVADDPKGESDE